VREILAMKYRFEDRLNLLLMKLANAFGAKVCTYYEYAAADRSFLAKASSSASVSVLKERPMMLEDVFAQRVIKTGSGFCVNATGQAPRSKKWFMLQPIRSGTRNELTGTLFIYLNNEKNHLKDETALLRKVGEMLSREISKNREMEAIKVQSLKYSAISQFSYDIANAATLPDLARMILSNVRLILESDTCVLRLRNSPSEDLKVNDTLSQRNPAWLKDILAVDEYVSGDMVPGKGVLRIDDLSQTGYAGNGVGAESVLVMGMEVGGVIVGTLSLYDKKNVEVSGGKGFSEEDAETLMSFGLQACKGLQRFMPFPAPVARKAAFNW